MKLSWDSTDVRIWEEALSSYRPCIVSLEKPELIPLDEFYTSELPGLIRSRRPRPHVTVSELSRLMQWKLKRGKWRPRLQGLVDSLQEDAVKSASEEAFAALPDVSKALTHLTALKGVGPATASAILSAYAPDVVPFMSHPAMAASIGNTKDYTLKQCLVFVEKLQEKAKELTVEGHLFTPSDVERALWSAAVSAKLKVSPEKPNEVQLAKSKRKRKR